MLAGILICLTNRFSIYLSTYISIAEGGLAALQHAPRRPNSEQTAIDFFGLALLAAVRILQASKLDSPKPEALRNPVEPHYSARKPMLTAKRTIKDARAEESLRFSLREVSSPGLAFARPRRSNPKRSSRFNLGLDGSPLWQDFGGNTIYCCCQDEQRLHSPELWYTV